MKKLIYFLNSISIFLAVIQILFLMLNKIFFTHIFYIFFYGFYLLSSILGIILFKKSKKLSFVFTIGAYTFLLFQIYSLFSL